MAMRNKDRPKRDDSALQDNYTIQDKKNVINYHKKKDADPSYQMKQYEHDSIMRQYGRKV